MKNIPGKWGSVRYMVLPVEAGSRPLPYWRELATGTPCGAQGSILLLTKVDGPKNVLIPAGRLARPLPIIREITESPAVFLA